MTLASRIVDVRLSSAEEATNLREQVLARLQAPVNHKSLPTVLLYDEAGLKIYDKITTDADEYYLFACEEEILKNNAQDIVRLLHAQAPPASDSLDSDPPAAGEVVIELGAGALRKTSHILNALAQTVDQSLFSFDNPPITYYALDLEERELDRTLKQTSSHLGDILAGKVDARGMLGTYDDGIKFVRQGGLEQIRISESPSNSPKSVSRERSARLSSISDPDLPLDDPQLRTPSLTPPSSGKSSPSPSQMLDSPLYFMFLGSSLGNFAPEEAAEFLKSLPLRPGSGDKLLLGLDHDNSKDLIERAYNDRHGITKEFIMNGLKGAGRILGQEDAFDVDGSSWEYVSFYNEEKHRHEAYYRSNVDQSLQVPASENHQEVKISFVKDELVHVEYSYKYSQEDTVALFSKANLRPIHRWTDSKRLYSLWLLERPSFDMPLIATPVKGSASPFGVPTLSDFQEMWKAWDMITLGMIPRSMLHAKPIDLRHKCLFYLGHIPAFLDIYLSRTLNEPHTEPVSFKNIFERGIDPNVDDPTQCHAHSEVPKSDDEWPALEEILLFRDNVRERLVKLYGQFESGERQLTRRGGRVLMMTFEHEQMHAETLLYMLLQGVTGLPSGTNPPEGFTAPDWELFKQADKHNYDDLVGSQSSTTVVLGPRNVILGHDDNEVEDDQLSLTPEHEFGWDNESPVREVSVPQFRIEWRPVTNGQFHKFWASEEGQSAVTLPASWLEVNGEIYVRTLYGPISLENAYHWPVITSYDDLSTYARVQGGRLPTEPELRMFFDTFCNGFLGGSNIGFRNWHPIGATTGSSRDNGRGHNGGVWEWTSTKLGSYDGYIPSKLYPGYSSDFFDGHHYVVVGGSYATPPRLAQRRTFSNWYQHNYPYAWVGARIAYDI